MPSIQDLINAANNRAEQPFDMDAYLSGLDPAIQAAADRSREGIPDPAPPPVADPAGDGAAPPAPVGPDATAGAAPPAAGGVPSPAPPPPPPAPDTVRIGDEELSLAEAQALLTLHRSITAPAPPFAAPPAPVVGAPAPPAAPAEAPLPTFIDPDNEGQVQMYRRLERLETDVSSRRQAEDQASRQNAMLGAATRAGNAFAARYPQLDQTDLTNLAHVVGASPLAKALGALGTPEAAETGFVDLMEATLWKHEAFRAKVAASPTPPPTAPAVQGGLSPDERRQALTGLSAASGLPTAPPVTPGANSMRPDGRMDEATRTRVVAQAADLIRRDQGGGF